MNPYRFVFEWILDGVADLGNGINLPACARSDDSVYDDCMPAPAYPC